MSLPPLSGIVAKGHKGHRHNWQRAERRKNGATFKLFVCTEHTEPIVKAYDMTVFNTNQLQGPIEYRMRHS